jgi:hypothetical protein
MVPRTWPKCVFLVERYVHLSTPVALKYKNKGISLLTFAPLIITPGHTLLHEISHLDTFGLAAGYPEETQPPKNGVPEFKYHGTIDWKGKSTAENARILKASKAKNKPETWQNAESFAASATGEFALFFVVQMCGRSS